MKPDEMRRVAKAVGTTAGNQMTETIMLVQYVLVGNAEICERLDKIIDRLEEPHDCYTKTDDGMIGR